MLSILLGGGMRYAYLHERHERIDQLVQQNSFEFEVLNQLIGRYYSEFIGHTQILSGLPSLRDYVAAPNAETRARVSRDFVDFSERVDTFEQIRFIGADGMEEIRVDAGGLLVPDAVLQNKSDRYYFRQGMSQPVGEIYASPLDLNVEQGEVELPYRPMLRLAVPVADPARGVAGLLVVNFGANHLFEALQQFSFNELWDLEVLNRQGYWMLHPDPERCWGFMFEGRREVNLGTEQPQLWAAVMNAATGQRLSDPGLSQWARIEPLKDLRVDGARAEAGERENAWLIFIHMDAAALAQLLAPLRQSFTLASLVAVGALLILSGVLYFRMRHRHELESLQRMHAKILSSAEVAVISVGLDGLIQFFNPAAEKLTGWQADELVGQHSPLILHEKFEIKQRAERLSQALGEVVPPDMGFFEAATRLTNDYVDEWVYTRKDGSKVPVLLTVSSFSDSAGNASGYLGVAVDISQQKQVQQALLEAKKEAEHLVQMKSQFLANMSHEIRTPMNGIIGLSNLLVSSELNEEQSMLAKNLVRSADVLMTVLNDILDFSKIEAGALELEATPFNMHDVVENSLLLFSTLAEKKGLELINRTSAGISGWYLGDSHRITQMLSNLLGNAVKFTETGEVMLSVEELESVEAGTVVRFEVKDSGIGMSESVRQQIFQPFTQANASTTRRFGGTGLGLTITTKLVEMMGGELGVESVEGEGSTFWVQLVLPTDAQAQFDAGEQDMLDYFDGRRALIVDDNVTNLLVLSSQLQQLGFQVKTFSDPNAAYLEYANDKAYDLLVLDYLMPELNGLELADRLQEQRRGGSSQLLVLSSANVLIDAKERERIGIGACLTKPVSPRIIFQTLSKLFSSKLKSAGSEQSAASEPTESDSAAATRQRVIIADDDTTNQMVLKLQLRKCGYEAEVVADGAELLQRLNEAPFDLVFMDCNMPVMDGYEATRELRANEAKGEFTACGHRLWIVAATAHAFEAEKDKANKAGMDDYLAKPVRQQEILRVLKNAPEGF